MGCLYVITPVSTNAVERKKKEYTKASQTALLGDTCGCEMNYVTRHFIQGS